MREPDEFGALVVAEARSWIGTRFHWGASVKGVGCDCKGLIAGVARALGRPEADTIEARLGAYGRKIDAVALKRGVERLFDRRATPEPGDVLLLSVAGKTQHMALYAGEGRMIHTYGKGPGCVIEVPMGRVWRSAIDSVWTWRH